jgi:hypothetical protein
VLANFILLHNTQSIRVGDGGAAHTIYTINRIKLAVNDTPLFLRLTNPMRKYVFVMQLP